MPGKRIDDLPDHTVQGIWEAQLAGGVVVENAIDEVIVRSAGVLADKGYWMWMFMAASEAGSSWRDLHGDYWVVHPDDGTIREW